MTELSALYQAVVLDHNRSPRNFRAVEPHDYSADGKNPLCGDRVHVELRLDGDGRIEDIGFDGEGCAISMATASIMTEVLMGRTLDEARDISARFQGLVSGRGGELSVDGDSALEKLQALAGVRDYPMRVRCATLAWNTLQAALDSPDGQRTE
ncbi:Fe-S cluster assembly sulfur transfer protein SufU [Spiribacter vilamensis]|uniref:Nitrogen fixation NifU-like protein n=1 Tax=Spiribacter vilamensis TaxID=531306 RepID=A0A4Q8D0A3_9GAMM|nr:SUF system NifU family Fe-S cluster assembly protein [Spiribacter vilamensis]RZU98647.1 nitrogen fixation NifU-like protein [Spiribacter vilamensis]TVO60095.1 SUF system NifU family Fe-S cluster assembly protein [Spiribacter vilamensis]